MNSTALILHPQASAKPRSHHHPQSAEIEVFGPSLTNAPTIRKRPGFYLPILSFDEFRDQPERVCNIHPQRRPPELDEWELEAHAARRIVAIVDHVLSGGLLTWDQLREIRWRALICEPYCQEDWLEDHIKF